MGQSHSRKIHINLTPSLKAGLARIYPALVKARGVQCYADAVRSALARGIRQLEIELADEVAPAAPTRHRSDGGPVEIQSNAR